LISSPEEQKLQNFNIPGGKSNLSISNSYEVMGKM